MVSFLRPVLAVLIATHWLAAQSTETAGRPGPAEKPERVVQGQVFDEWGKPLAGVLAFAVPKAEIDVQLGRRAPAARSDAAGWFRFALPVKKDKDKPLADTLVLTKAGWETCIQKIPASAWTVRPQVNAGILEPAVAADSVGLEMVRVLGQLRGGAAGELALSPRAVELGRFHLSPGVDRPIQVLGPDGKGLPGVVVEARSILEAQRNFAVDGGKARGARTTRARTQQEGRALLCGMPRGGAVLRIDHAGYELLQQRIQGKSPPVQVVLHPLREVKGVVLDDQGKPCKARVELLSESGAGPVRKTSEEDGTFSLECRSPQRFRLRATPLGSMAKTHSPGFSPLLAQSQQGIQLTLPLKPKKPGPPAKKKPARPKSAVKRPARLRVLVVDAETGLPLTDFRAWSTWMSRPYLDNRSYLEGRLRGSGSKPDEPGVVRLAGATSVANRYGAVKVTAPGYALQYVDGLEWDPRQPPRLELRMLPAAVVRGRVRTTDEKARKSATIYLYGTDRLGRTMKSRSSKLDARGGFSFVDLEPGSYRLRSRISKQYRDVQTLRVKAGDRHDLVLSAAAGLVALEGRVRGLPEGVRASLQLSTPNVLRNLLSNPMNSVAGIDLGLRPDGSFAATGLAPKEYEVVLSLDDQLGRGKRIHLPLEPIRLRRFQPPLELDVAAELPVEVRGRVRIDGVDFDPARFVLSAEAPGSTSMYSFFYRTVRRLSFSGLWTGVGADGRFALKVPRGKWVLRLTDLSTGMTCFPGGCRLDLRRSAPPRELVLGVVLHKVKLRLVSADEGVDPVVRWLDIRCSPPSSQTFSYSNTQAYAAGISMLRRGPEVELVLPAGKVEFRAHSGLSGMAEPGLKLTSAVGVGSFTIPPAEAGVLRLTVDLPELAVPAAGQQGPVKPVEKQAKVEAAEEVVEEEVRRR